MSVFLLFLAIICTVSSIVVAREGHIGASAYIAFVGIIMLFLAFFEWFKKKEEE